MGNARDDADRMNWERDAPDESLWCPDGVESSEGFFDPAGYDPNDCAGCGCPKSEHKLEPMNDGDYVLVHRAKIKALEAEVKSLKDKAHETWMDTTANMVKRDLFERVMWRADDLDGMNAQLRKDLDAEKNTNADLVKDHDALLTLAGMLLPDRGFVWERQELIDAVAGLQSEVVRLRELTRIHIHCGNCGYRYSYLRADDPDGEKARYEHAEHCY